MGRFDPTSGEVTELRDVRGIDFNRGVKLLRQKNMLDALQHGRPNVITVQEVLIEMLKDEIRGVQFVDEEGT